MEELLGVFNGKGGGRSVLGHTYAVTYSIHQFVLKQQQRKKKTVIKKKKMDRNSSHTQAKPKISRKKRKKCIEQKPQKSSSKKSLKNKIEKYFKKFAKRAWKRLDSYDRTIFHGVLIAICVLTVIVRFSCIIRQAEENLIINPRAHVSNIPMKINVHGNQTEPTIIDVHERESIQIKSQLEPILDQLQSIVTDRIKYDNTRPEIGLDAYWKKQRITDDHTDYKILNEQLASDQEIEIKYWSQCPEEINVQDVKQEQVGTQKYQQNPNTYLTGALIWGPNNQLRGLRELIFLAIKLNRTIIIPPFFKHYAMDSSAQEKSHTIPAKYRVNVPKIKQFISVLDHDQYSKICSKHFNVLLAGRRDICHADKSDRIDQLTDYLNFDRVKLTPKGAAYPFDGFYCLNETNRLEPDLKKLMRLQPNVKKQLLLPFQSEKIKEIFGFDQSAQKNENLPCALALFIYKSFNMKTVMYDEEKLKKRQPGSGGGFYQIENFEDNGPI